MPAGSADELLGLGPGQRGQLAGEDDGLPLKGGRAGRMLSPELKAQVQKFPDQGPVTAALKITDQALPNHFADPGDGRKVILS